MYAVLLCLLLMTLHASGQDFDADCITPTGLASHCVSIHDCDKLKPLIPLPGNQREELKKWHCGFDGNVPKVCCPPTTTKNRCITVTAKAGVCVSPQACPTIAALLKWPISRDNLELFMRSRCNGPENSVCCEEPVRNPATVQPNNRFDLTPAEIVTQNPISSSSVQLTTTPVDTPNCNAVDIPSIDSGCCGIDSTGTNRIVGGNATAIDQYPWLAVIEYSDPRWICGGALISRRWVLTAAHCVVRTNMKSRNPKSVRLGDYDISNPGADCIEVEGGGTDCTAEPLSIPISESIVHPEYGTAVKVVHSNDIALLRLQFLAPYSDFIRPICLPVSDVLLSPPPNMRLYVAGWGAMSESQPSSDIKLHVILPLFQQEDCLRQYSVRGIPIIWDKQMCAGGEANKDSCRGDSGGPLMYPEGEKAFQAVGITSFGIKQCGSSGRPSVYTKVYPYMDWIKSVAKP